MSDFWARGDFWTDADDLDFEDLVSDASDDTAIIARNMGTVSDGHGGYIEDWRNSGTVAVKMSAIGGSPIEQMIGQQLVGVSDMMLTMPVGTDIRSSDRVTVGSQVYEVDGVTPPRTHETRRRVYARAVGNA